MTHPAGRRALCLCGHNRMNHAYASRDQHCLECGTDKCAKFAPLYRRASDVEFTKLLAEVIQR